MSSTGRSSAVRRLRDYLDELDKTTRRPDEEPLRVAVARQARERLAEMTDPCREPLPAATCPSGRDWCRPNTPCMTCRLSQAVLTPKEKR